MKNMEYRITYLKEDVDFIKDDNGDEMEVNSLKGGHGIYKAESVYEAIKRLEFDVHGRFVITDVEKYKDDIKMESTLFDEDTSILELKHR